MKSELEKARAALANVERALSAERDGAAALEQELKELTQERDRLWGSGDAKKIVEGDRLAAKIRPALEALTVRREKVGVFTEQVETMQTRVAELEHAEERQALHQLRAELWREQSKFALSLRADLEKVQKQVHALAAQHGDFQGRYQRTVSERGEAILSNRMRGLQYVIEKALHLLKDFKTEGP